MLRCVVVYLLAMLLLGDLSAHTYSRSLKDIIQSAQKNNLIRSAIYARERESAKKQALYGAFLPQVGVSLQYEDTNQPFLFQPYKTSVAGIEASWSIFNGFKTLSSFKAQSSLLQGAVEAEEDTRQKVFLQLIEEYYSYLKSLADLRILKAQEGELVANLQRLESLYQNELVALDALEAIKAQKAQNAYQINGAMLQAQIHKEQIELLSHSDFVDLHEEFLSIQKEFSRQDGLICQREGVVLEDRSGISHIKTPKIYGENGLSFLDSSTALSENSFVVLEPKPTHSLKAAEQSVIALEQSIDTHTYLPQLNAFVRYAYYKYDSLYIPPIPLPLNIASEDLKGTQMTFGFSLSFPLFDTLSTLRQKEAARYEFLSAKTKLDYQKDQQNRQIKIAHNAMQNAREKIQWATLRAQSAKTSYCYAKQKFDSGLISHIEYLASLSNELSARAMVSQSYFDYEISKARLVFASGASLEEFIED